MLVQEQIFFHNKQFLGIFLQFTGSQTAASPFTAPVLLHTQIMKVLSVPPASQNAMATGGMMCSLESCNFFSLVFPQNLAQELRSAHSGLAQ